MTKTIDYSDAYEAVELICKEMEKRIDYFADDNKEDVSPALKSFMLETNRILSRAILMALSGMAK